MVPLVALALLTMVTGTAGASVTSGSLMRESAAAAARYCAINDIDGHTINDTDVTVVTSASTHGITNRWCEAPSGSVAAHKTDVWFAGDNVFETHVNISYRFPDGSVADFHAESRVFTDDRIIAGCSVSPAGSKPSPYGCYTSTSYLGGSHGEVRFVLVRVAPSS